METILENTNFDFKDAQLPRIKKPSRRLQAFVGETQDNEHSISDVQQYFKVNTYFASLDRVLSEMGHRFNEEDQSILTSLSSLIFSQTPEEEAFNAVADFYGLDKDLLQVDHKLLQQFKNNLESTYNASSLYEELFGTGLLPLMPKFEKVLRIFTSIPATSCSSERSFSALRRIKTYVRNRMGQDRLSDVAVLNIEKSYANLVLKNYMNDVIDAFANESSYRKSILL